MDLNGKVAVVTGAARGIGAAIAERLAQAGAAVMAVDILDCEETVARIRAAGGKADSCKADITDPEAVAALARRTETELGAAHILVNNAGLHPHPTPLPEVTFDYWRRTMAVNVDSMFLTIQAFLPQLKANDWGRIINLSSSSVNVAPPMGVPYVSSKAAVVGLTRAVATEVGRDNITVNAVAPNPVRTPGAEGGSVSEEMFEQIAQMQSVPRVMLPEHVVGMIAFLCSDEAAFITGQHLHVDGGMVKGD